MVADRLVRLTEHDDGVNRWRMAHVSPTAVLTGLIRGYCDYDETTGGFTTRRELPHGEGVVIVNLGAPIAIVGGDGRTITLRAGEGFVAGVHLRPALSRSIGAQRGIHVFLPLASLRRLLGMPMHALFDRVVPLDALLGRGAGDLGERLAEARTLDARVALLDRHLTRRFADTPPMSVADAAALARVAGRPDQDLVEVARMIGWSRKHLAHRVRDAIGVGPRSYRRLLRFQSTIGAIGDGSGMDANWAAFAAGRGYCDQSHLIREFREFAGMTPQTYVARLAGGGGGLIEA